MTAEDVLAAEAVAISGASLARVWIMGPGDSCSTCAMAVECPERTSCLHLVSSVGLTARLEGPFRRFPVGARQVGSVVRSGTPLLLNDGLEASGLADPGWFSLHRIRSFGAWPIGAEGDPVGVLAIFCRQPIEPAVARAIEGLARIAALALAPAPAAPGAPATMAVVQREAILETLRRTRGRVSGAGGAAELLGMKSTTLESRIRRLGLRKPPFQRQTRGGSSPA